MKHPHASIPGHPRSHRLSVRVSEHEYRELATRAQRAHARTPSEYVRVAALRGRWFEVGSHQAQRDLIQAIIQVAGEIQATPPGPTRDRALERAIAALDRVVS